MTETHGSVVINERPVTKKERVQKIVGATMTSFAMALYLVSYGPITRSEIAAPQTEVASAVQEVSAAEQVVVPTDTSFSVYIPFLKTKSVVIPNVDPFNEQEYSEELSKGVAQAKGTGFPGEGKRIFLFAHSTNSLLNIAQYNAIFYDLGKIPEGEVVELYYNGEVHQYRVTEKKVVAATDVQWVSPKDGEELILQTCYPPGTSWKRLLVFATPV